MTPEFSHIVRAHDVGGIVRHETMAAGDAERAGLAVRFDLLALDRLTADLNLVRDAAGIRVTGWFDAAGTQACVMSAEPVGFALSEPIDLRFGDAGDPEVELTDHDLLPLDGDDLDLGEAVAQSLGLALDPYPRAPEAVRAAAARFVISEEEAAAREAADKARANPFAALRR